VQLEVLPPVSECLLPAAQAAIVSPFATAKKARCRSTGFLMLIWALLQSQGGPNSPGRQLILISQSQRRSVERRAPVRVADTRRNGLHLVPTRIEFDDFPIT